MSTEITEEVFDAVAAPIVVAHGLASLEAQLEVLRDVDNALADAFAQWEPTNRQRAVGDLRRGLADARNALDRLDDVLVRIVDTDGAA